VIAWNSYVRRKYLVKWNRYEMLFGKRPFEHQNTEMVREMIQNSDVSFPVQI